MLITITESLQNASYYSNLAMIRVDCCGVFSSVPAIVIGVTGNRLAFRSLRCGEDNAGLPGDNCLIGFNDKETWLGSLLFTNLLFTLTLVVAVLVTFVLALLCSERYVTQAGGPIYTSPPPPQMMACVFYSCSTLTGGVAFYLLFMEIKRSRSDKSPEAQECLSSFGAACLVMSVLSYICTAFMAVVLSFFRFTEGEESANDESQQAEAMHSPDGTDHPAAPLCHTLSYVLTPLMEVFYGVPHRPFDVRRDAKPLEVKKLELYCGHQPLLFGGWVARF